MTCALCSLLGVFVGKWKSPTLAVTDAAKTVKAPKSSPSALVPTVKPPPFTSAIASMDWVRAQMEKGDTTAAERLDLAKVLVNNFRRMDPRVIASIILGLPRGEESDHLLWSFITDWSISDAEEALRFIEALPSDRMNTIGVLQNAAFGLTRLPAERVLAFAAKLDDKGRAYIAEGLVALADQAGSWRNTSVILDKLNVTPQKDSLSAEWRLGMQLAEIDPQALESRIAAETDILKHDELLHGYAMHVGLHNPLRGLELEVQIQQPEKRAKQITNRVEYWLTNDRAAALAWLRSDAARQLMDSDKRNELLSFYPKEVAP